MKRNAKELVRDKLRILLIDDDHDFGNLFLSHADFSGIEATHYESLEATGSVGCFRDYDAVVLDINLEHLSGFEIAEYIQVFFTDKPVILTSSDILDAKMPLPPCIKSFIPKKDGMDELIRMATSHSYAKEIIEREAH